MDALAVVDPDRPALERVGDLLRAVQVGSRARGFGQQDGGARRKPHRKGVDRVGGVGSDAVEGELGEEGTFLASQVIPRCPSKYEMQQRMEAGEEMPYDPNAPLPGQS